MATQFSTADNLPWKGRFFTIWSGQALSLLGSQLVGFALVWYLTVRTGSATVLATASLAGIIPGVVLGPFMGPLVDRWNRRVTMIIADTIIALVTLGLAGLFALGEVAIWQIYLLMFIRSVAGGFHGNSMAASTSLMVPVENLTRVQGLNQMLNGGLNIISAPLGALLYGILPLMWILMLDVFSALFAIVPLFFFEIPQPDRKVSEELSGVKPSFGAELKAGFQYVWNWKGLLIILAMASFINFLLNPAFSLMPLLVSDHFGKGALELGYLESTFGVAVIIGGLLLGAWGGFKRQILTTMLGLSFMGIGIIPLGLLPSDAFAWVFLSYIISGVAMPITNGSLMGVVQAKVAPDVQGRVFTLLSAAAGGMSPLGLLIAGPVSDLVGIQTWFVLGGAACLLMALAGVAIPAVLNFEDYDDGRGNGVVEIPVPVD